MLSCQQGIQCSGACQFGIVMCNNAISSGSLVARDRRGIFEDPAHFCRTKLGKCGMNLGQTCLEGGTFVRSHHFYLSIDQNARVFHKLWPTWLGQQRIFRTRTWLFWVRCFRVYGDHCPVQSPEHGQLTVVGCIHLLCSRTITRRRIICNSSNDWFSSARTCEHSLKHRCHQL